ncbi:MAG: HTH domain-containing protein [bacterium]
MNVEKDIERKIKQKEEAVQGLRDQLLRAESYLEALKDSLHMVQKKSSVANGDTIRPGSMVHKALTALRNAKKPMHVNELLQHMGKEPTKKNRTSLSGSLGFYVRQEMVFTRPAPNTFGLVEFEAPTEEELPDSFGT